MLRPGGYPARMFGPRLTRVFASRGHALWWSAMVLVTAYCVAADPPTPVAPPPDTAAPASDTNRQEPDPWAAVTRAGHGAKASGPQDRGKGLRDTAQTRE
ncbi:hypothetical protein [Parasphingorhabdus sp.]|uniref:hypothetical protein n=1 Tax=Parasphingorhabdus sp. TaxID=2709688 RepID=UPI003001CF91